MDKRASQNITDLWPSAADEVGVRRFTNAMAEKMEAKRIDGRSGWNNAEQCAVDDLKRMLVEHIPKGDMVDIANFAMMIWNRENPNG